jgi:hypothetical protein
MNVERRLIAILQATPGLAGVLIRYGYTPQEDEKRVPTLPYMVLERSGSEWLETICGTYTNGCFVDVVLTTYQKDSFSARELGQIARLALLTSDEVPSLTNETDNYDPEARAWSVSQIFRVWDDAPSVN